MDWNHEVRRAATVDVTKPLRVAVIGQGFMGRAHSLAWSRANALQASARQTHLVVLCGRDPDALVANAKLLQFDEVARDWRASVARSDVDIVDVCTPGDLHAAVSIAALEAGKHVLCEKPLARTLAEAQAMAASAAVAAARGQVAMVGFNYRRVPALARAREMISSGLIGSVRECRATYLQDWLVDEDFPMTWRLRAEDAGSGALGDLGSHLVDLVQHLCDSSVVEVCGFRQTFVPSRPEGREGPGLTAAATSPVRTGVVSVDDAFVALGHLDNGALVSLEASRVAAGHKNGMALEVNGTSGSIRFDLERLNELELYEVNDPRAGFKRVLVTEATDSYAGQWWPPGHMLGWEHSFVHQCQDLLAAVDGSTPVEPSFVQAVQVQAVLECIARSSESRRWESVVVERGAA